MRRGMILLAVLALFVLAVPLTASAGGNSHAKANGEVYWEGGSSRQFELYTEFSLHDAPPGEYSDRGMLYHENITTGTWRMVEFSYVDISSDMVAFACGVIVDASDTDDIGAGQAMWLKDVSTPGSDGDMIGLYKKADLEAACNLQGSWEGNGLVTGGNLTVHLPKF